MLSLLVDFANQERARVTHTVVFFIFLVSNIGGMLTPLGDPPLFLGYLQGVPFAWTFRLWGQWLFMTAALLALYFVWDSRHHAHETRTALQRDRTQIEPLRIEGLENALWLAGVVGAVLIIISLFVDWNLAAFIVEIFWLLISVFGLARYYARR